MYRYLIFTTPYADSYNWKSLAFTKQVKLYNDTQCQYSLHDVPVDITFNTVGTLDYSLSITGFATFLNYTGF